jgi:hypothetical protein
MPGKYDIVFYNESIEINADRQSMNYASKILQTLYLPNDIICIILEYWFTNAYVRTLNKMLDTALNDESKYMLRCEYYTGIIAAYDTDWFMISDNLVMWTTYVIYRKDNNRMFSIWRIRNVPNHINSDIYTLIDTHIIDDCMNNTIAMLLKTVPWNNNCMIN